MSQYVAGLDLGAGTAKCVIMDEGRQVVGKGKAKTRADFEAVAKEALGAALAQAGVKEEQLAYVATTGLGRYSIPNRDIQITDLTCGARGAFGLFAETQFVLDIGAQSTRAIRLRERGRVKEFHMNEKCAAGSGGFLERVAKYLEVRLEELGDLSLKSRQPQTISSICAVLAESEIINHVSEGREIPDIIRGVHLSLADRSLMQLRRIGFEDGAALTFIGGVARQAGMVQACEERFKVKINIPQEPQLVAAYGAALLGFSRLEKKHVVASSVPGRA